MIPVSQKFLDTVAGDHRRITVAEAWPPGFFLEQPGQSGALLSLPITGGTLRSDKQSVNRRRVTFKSMIEQETESGENIVPIDGNSILAPISTTSRPCSSTFLAPTAGKCLLFHM